MDFSAIIKRAWNITWRYKALWVLGLFAGMSGCQGGGGSGGGGGGGGNGSGTGSDNLGGRLDNLPDLGREMDRLTSYLPAIIAGAVLLFVLWIVWSVLAIAARGGLVRGVSEIEEGGSPALGALWSAGFARWWSLVGLGFVLKFPVFLGGLAILAAVLVPLVPAIIAEREPGPEVLVPIIGSLCIGLPILAILGFVLDVLYLIALRYVMLGHQPVMASVKSAWGFMRVRFKDTFLLYLINGALNLAAGIVLAIPAIIIAIGVVVPAVAGAASRNWGVVGGSVIAGVAIMSLVAMFFNGVWGTFTSALWTLAFREITGMSRPAQQSLPVREPSPYQPSVAEQPPMAPPAPPAPPAGPPVAGYPPEDADGSGPPTA